jgi:predicted DNA-binding transcriptional regulator AlpA
MNTTNHAAETLLRLPQVLERFPVSRSEWYAGIKEGRYGYQCLPQVSA